MPKSGRFANSSDYPAHNRSADVPGENFGLLPACRPSRPLLACPSFESVGRRRTGQRPRGARRRPGTCFGCLCGRGSSSPCSHPATATPRAGGCTSTFAALAAAAAVSWVPAESPLLRETLVRHIMAAAEAAQSQARERSCASRPHLQQRPHCFRGSRRSGTVIAPALAAVSAGVGRSKYLVAAMPPARYATLHW
jgi:hypothetical protein